MIDMCHPAKVHFFLPIIHHLLEKNHEVTVTAKSKDVTLELLEEHSIPYIEIGEHHTSLLGKVAGLIQRNRELYRLMKRIRPDLAMGFASPYIAQISFLNRIPCIMFCDTERAYLENFASIPFSQYLVSPRCSGFKIKEQDLPIDGLFEQMYLSKQYFQPDKKAIEVLNLKNNDVYIVLRIVAWNAAHDTNPHFFTTDDIREFVKILSDYGRVLISSEGGVPPDLQRYLLPSKPSEFHDVLAFSSLCISEGAKTAAEAALLGIPSIIMNSAEGGSLRVLEKAGLLSILPDPQDALETSKNIIMNLTQEKIEKQKSAVAFWNSHANIERQIFHYIDEVLDKQNPRE